MKLLFRILSKTILFGSVFCGLFFIQNVLAISTPQLIEPDNDSSTSDTSPKLGWNYNDSCPTNASCFIVQVDDSADFSTPDKSTYTDNLSYSPSLGMGVWYWRVKAKDQTGNWSDFSENRSFQIIDGVVNNPTTVPTNTPSSSQSSPGATAGFVISQVPSNISSENSFSVALAVTSLSPNSEYFLKSAFYKVGSTNYFGKTMVLGNWVKNNETYLNQFKILTDGSGSFTGNLEVLVDDGDSGFSGSGEYLLKVGRYNSSGSGPTWSNSVSLQISGESKTASSKTSTSKVTNSTPKPSTTALTTTSMAKSGNLGSSEASGGNASTSSALYELPDLGLVAGASTQSSEVAGDKRFSRIRNWWYVAAGLLIILATGYVVVKERRKT